MNTYYIACGVRREPIFLYYGILIYNTVDDIYFKWLIAREYVAVPIGEFGTIDQNPAHT